MNANDKNIFYTGSFKSCLKETLPGLEELIEISSGKMEYQIGMMQNIHVKRIEFCVYKIFKEINLSLNKENLKRVSIILPTGNERQTKYLLDFGLNTEIFLLSYEWEIGKFSENTNSISANLIIKSDFKSISSDTIEDEFNAFLSEPLILNEQGFFEKISIV